MDRVRRRQGPDRSRKRRLVQRFCQRFKGKVPCLDKFRNQRARTSGPRTFQVSQAGRVVRPWRGIAVAKQPLHLGKTRKPQDLAKPHEGGWRDIRLGRQFSHGRDGNAVHIGRDMGGAGLQAPRQSIRDGTKAFAKFRDSPWGAFRGMFIFDTFTMRACSLASLFQIASGNRTSVLPDKQRPPHPAVWPHT
jgi:hypothetical protein